MKIMCGSGTQTTVQADGSTWISYVTAWLCYGGATPSSSCNKEERKEENGGHPAVSGLSSLNKKKTWYI